MTSKRSKGVLVTVGAVGLGLAMASSAWAQNKFYREVEKDGRLYVFARMKAFDAFDRSGEMSPSSTRPNYGPHGETVVFDSEDAADLYSFKQEKPAEPAKPKEAPKPADNFSVRVGGTIFADYTYTDTPTIVDADKNVVHKSEFEVRRAYINITGTISDLIAFRITPDVASRQATSASGLPAGATVSSNFDGSLTIRLKYAYGQVNFDRFLTKGSWARIGQQQTPFVDFMEGVYRYRFQGSIFVDREGYLSSSDVGLSARVALPNDYGDVHLGYYNGDTYTKAETNDQKAFQIRATLRPLPKEDALKGLRLTVFYDNDAPIKLGSRDRLVAAATFEHKYANAGFEYLDAKDRSSINKAEVKSNGWTVWATPRSQTGLEGLIRYDSLKPNKDVDAKKTRLILGVAYWFKVQKAPFAAAVLGDFEQVKYDTLLGKPTEKRYELKTLFNF
jgi:hypothetical protein